MQVVPDLILKATCPEVLYLNMAGNFLCNLIECPSESIPEIVEELFKETAKTILPTGVGHAWDAITRSSSF